MGGIIEIGGGVLTIGGQVVGTGTQVNIAGLQAAVIGQYRNANGFPGKTWAINSGWQDNTGVMLSRLTNASSIAGGLSSGMEYSEGGPHISLVNPTNQYWVTWVQTSGAKYVGQVTIGGGAATMNQSSIFVLPISGGGQNTCFSTPPGEYN